MREKQKPLWISHRGYKEGAAENTPEAFTAAVNMGFTALETDLRITRDNHIVLIHDPSLQRLADDHRRIGDLSRSQLEEIRLKGAGHPMFLDQLVEEFGSYTWIFDIKPENGERTIQALAAWAHAHDLEPWLTAHSKFLTWQEIHEKLLKDLIPGMTFYARKYECWRAGFSALVRMPRLGAIKPNRTYALTPSLAGISLFRETMVEYFHRRRARTLAFLPATALEACAALQAGFDEILTDGQIIG